jgi:choline dehydrogenase-like flavoprotein
MTHERHVIVIGSGPSGAMAALSLLEQGIPVTMLESGQTFQRGLVVRMMGRNLYRRWPTGAAGQRYVASGDPDTQWYHALTPGGLSNWWTAAVPRFAPDDFVEGARLHERYRWPISYDDLVPYYERVERLLEVVGEPRDLPNLPAPGVVHQHRLPRDWQRIAHYAESFGHGLAPVPLANGPRWMLRRTGAAFNSISRIVQKLSRHPHFQLLLGAHAVRLEWRGDRNRVDSVLFFDRATRAERRVAGAAVVVAAGPLGSTRLLLNSRSHDFPEGLGDTEGILGRFLHDHPNDWCTVELSRPLTRLVHAAYLTRAPHRSSVPLLAASFTFGPASPRDRIISTVTPIKAKTFGLVTFGTMVPTDRSYVRLHPEKKDELGLPQLDIHIRFDDDALRSIAAARKRMQAIMEAAGYRCTIHCTVPRLVPGSSAHYGGTVRMHSSPKHGMVDGWNRLHAVDNVAVVDASSFTTGVEKNPTLTAMALAARAAERLAHDLKTGSLGSRPGLAHAV